MRAPRRMLGPFRSTWRRSVRPTHLLAMEDGPAGILAAHRVKIACVAVGEVPAHHAVDALLR